MKPISVLFLLLLFVLVSAAQADVPQLISYQGGIAVEGEPFAGIGQFRFALTNADGSTSYWSNDGSSVAGAAPTAAVSLSVTGGLYVVHLGDANLASMTALPPTLFADNAEVYLRVWFDDGANGVQQLTPDHRITSVGYALSAQQAHTVADGAVITATIAADAVTGDKIQDATVTGADLADGTITIADLDATSIGLWSTANGDVYRSSGNVGIGIPVPAAKLHVNGGVLATSFTGNGAGLTGLAVAQVGDGDTSLVETTAANDSGAALIGVFDELVNSDAATVQVALKDLDTAVTAAAVPQNLFETVALPDASKLVAGSAAGTLTVANGAGIAVTGDAGSDTLTIAVADGGIGAAQLADGAVTSAKITPAFYQATGAAPDVVDPTGTVTATVVFDRMFNAVPDVVVPAGWALSGASTATGFTATAGFASVVIDDSLGRVTSLAVVDGRPAISYEDNSTSDLKYAIAPNADGSGTWTTVTVDSAGFVGEYTSLVVVDDQLLR